MKMIKTLALSLECLFVLFVSSCGSSSPSQPGLATLLVPSITPVRAVLSPTTVQPTASLQDALKKIHDQFKIDPSKGCYDIAQPNPEYQQALQKMTALLLNDLRAQSLSFAEREALFNQVTGFSGVRFIAGSGTASLVSLPTNRGHNLACGSHARSPDALYVVDQQGVIYDLGADGLLGQASWVGDRWMVLFKLKLDSSSGPTRWMLWHVGQTSGKWQTLVEFEFIPSPYNSIPPPPLRFENGYQTMIADLDYWWADDPCEFTATFKNAFKHDDWKMRRTYQLTGNTYKLVSSAMLTLPVRRKDTGEIIALNWQSYCAGPIK